MTQKELKAMDIRKTNAARLMDKGDISGPDALAMIVAPSPALLSASLEAAGEVPDVPDTPRPRVTSARRARPPKRSLPREVTLDELLASLR